MKLGAMLGVDYVHSIYKNDNCGVNHNFNLYKSEG